MKTIPFLFLLFTLTMPFMSSAQDLDAEDVESAIQGEDLVVSDEIAALTDNADIGEERQEDMIHPEGENDWSLGGEDLPAEEFE